MSREEAIQKVTAFRNYLMAGNPIWDVDEVREAFDMAIEELTNEPGWIPVSERLPEPYYTVLVYEEGNKNIWTAYIDDWSGKWQLPVLYGEDQLFEDSDYDSIVAWMPLPEPWKGEEDEQI